jgi:hypothetical protein
MVFIPKEAQEKINALEEEVQRLRDNQASIQAPPPPPPTIVKNGVHGFWLFLSLLLIALLVVMQFVNIPFLSKKSGGTGISADSLATLSNTAARVADYEAVEKFRKAADGAPGVVYRVQIGAYKGQPLAGNEPNLEEIFEHQKDGFNVYSLGTFADLERAQAFQNVCFEMGMEKAYIIAFKDGKPVSLGQAAQKAQ